MGTDWTPQTSLSRMRQFWVAWCVAVLLLAIAVGGFAYLISLSEAWPLSYKLVGRSLAGLVVAFALYDAYRLAAQGTAALQEVLAQNLGLMVSAELERLQSAAASRRALLVQMDAEMLADPTSIQDRLALAVPTYGAYRDDVQSLLGNPTEAALQRVLISIREYNDMLGRYRRGEAAHDVGLPDFAEDDLADKVEELSDRISAALASIARQIEGSPGRPGGAGGMPR
jgi:hypothetical protein